MSTTERLSGRIALMVAHCAGMVDLVALPVWVGTLVSHYGLDPQQAGGLATLFLVGAAASSMFFASRFERMRPRQSAALGFALAGLAFVGVASVASYSLMAVLHFCAGAAASCALSATHGTIGRSARPHRLFALVGAALGIFAILFLGATPKLVANLGGPALFWIFGGIMLVAALITAVAFPAPPTVAQAQLAAPRPALDAPVWFGAVGVTCMAVVQATMFSFLERVGAARGFSFEMVTGVLIGLGVVNLVPAPLAALLEKRWRARTVLLAGPVVQAALALLITQSSGFVAYAAGALFFAAVLIFTHTFAFGLLAQLEPSGRMLAATPAMVMTGSAIGPILGGTVVKFAGYGALGIAAVAIDIAAIACFARARRAAPAAAAQSAAHRKPAM